MRKFFGRIFDKQFVSGLIGETILILMVGGAVVAAVIYVLVRLGMVLLAK